MSKTERWTPEDLIATKIILENLLDNDVSPVSVGELTAVIEWAARNQLSSAELAQTEQISYQTINDRTIPYVRRARQRAANVLKNLSPSDLAEGDFDDIYAKLNIKKPQETVLTKEPDLPVHSAASRKQGRRLTVSGLYGGIVTMLYDVGSVLNDPHVPMSHADLPIGVLGGLVGSLSVSPIEEIRSRTLGNRIRRASRSVLTVMTDGLASAGATGSLREGIIGSLSTAAGIGITKLYNNSTYKKN